MPSKLLERGQLYFSCEADETEIPRVIETIGDDWIVFASDYSHFDSRFPGASQPIIENDRSVTHPSARSSTTTPGGSIHWARKGNSCREQVDAFSRVGVALIIVHAVFR